MTDVRINGTSIVSEGVADIPLYESWETVVDEFVVEPDVNQFKFTFDQSYKKLSIKVDSPNCNANTAFTVKNLIGNNVNINSFFNNALTAGNTSATYTIEKYADDAYRFDVMKYNNRGYGKQQNTTNENSFVHIPKYDLSGNMATDVAITGIFFGFGAALQSNTKITIVGVRV